MNKQVPIHKHKHLFMYACVLGCFSHVQLFVTPQSVACKAPLSMGFFRQEYWTGLPCPPPGECSPPRDRACISCVSCHAGGFFTTSKTWKALYLHICLSMCRQGRPVELLKASSQEVPYEGGVSHFTVLQGQRLMVSELLLSD